MGGPPLNSQVTPLPQNLPFRIVSKTIGSGAYASIRKAIPRDRSGPVIAVKFINKEHAFRSGRLRPKQLQLEVALHERVGNRKNGHHNIIEFLAHGDDAAWVWVGLELAEGGDLFDKIEADAGCAEGVAHLYFAQLVNAVGWCHGKGVAHRDIKPENMLLGGNGDLKLADFGLATQFAVPGRMGERKRCGMVCGSPPYIAPEILEVGQKNVKRKQGEEKEGYDPQGSDVWSVAIVLFVLLAGNTPWDMPDAQQSYEYYDYVKSGGRPQDELWEKIPAEALSLVRGMLKIQPAERFDLGGVRKHPWFTRENRNLTADGKVRDPLDVPTQLLGGLSIDPDAPLPPSQQQRQQQQQQKQEATTTDAMDIDSARPLDPAWTKLASTQPETPVADQPFDWEAPQRLGGISASQPTTAQDNQQPITRRQITEEDLLAALAEDPSMSQFSQVPVGSMTATQQARRFADLVPAQSLARFYSYFGFPELLPLLVSALHRLNIPVAEPSRAALEGREDVVSFRVKALDARQQPLQGTISVERVEVRTHAAMEVLEVRFLKAKGDPLGWRRLFKQVAVLCKDAIPWPKKTAESQQSQGGF